MKLRINAKIISKLNPCKDRFDNFKKHYPRFSGDVQEFLTLEKITFSDKLWVTLRLVPRDVVEQFAFDCAVKDADAAADAAAAYAADADAAAAADAAAYAADAAAYAADAAAYAAAAAAYAADADAAAAREKSQNDSLDALAWLIEDYKVKERA